MGYRCYPIDPATGQKASPDFWANLLGISLEHLELYQGYLQVHNFVNTARWSNSQLQQEYLGSNAGFNLYLLKEAIPELAQLDHYYTEGFGKLAELAAALQLPPIDESKGGRLLDQAEKVQEVLTRVGFPGASNQVKELIWC